MVLPGRSRPATLRISIPSNDLLNSNSSSFRCARPIPFKSLRISAKRQYFSLNFVETEGPMAQAALTGVDTWMTREWREKQRYWRLERTTWRDDDIEFRSQEILLWQEEQSFFEARRRWREEDMKQRSIDNSRYLWNRFSELNRRDVEEKSEQLRSMSWLSGLVTSFTMTSPVEFNIVFDSISMAQLTTYAIFAAIVPTIMMTSTVICVYLLGRVLKMGKMFVAEDVEEEFMKQCRISAESNGTLPTPPKPRQTFERFWNIRCNNDWEKSFCLFVLGICFFLALLCTMGFIKFSFANGVAILFTAVIGVVFFIWLGAQLTWGTYLRETQAESHCLVNVNIPEEAHLQQNPLQWHSQPGSDSYKIEHGPSSKYYKGIYVGTHLDVPNIY